MSAIDNGPTSSVCKGDGTRRNTIGRVKSSCDRAVACRT